MDHSRERKQKKHSVVSKDMATVPVPVPYSTVLNGSHKLKIVFTAVVLKYFLFLARNKKLYLYNSTGTGSVKKNI